MITWFLTRHVAYNMVVYSIWKHMSDVMPVGCFRGTNDSLVGPLAAPKGFMHYLEPFHNPDGFVCFDQIVKWTFLTALLALQVITIAWFMLVINVAIKVITGCGAEDVRSDDEGEEEQEEFEYEEAEPVEEEVGVEDIDLKAWERRTGVKRTASASTGVTLPGHSDRKELLGRIGCEKQVD